MADITTASFDSAFWPDQVVEAIALGVITGAPFARALTPLPTSKPATSFPRANPTGFDWVGEGAPLPAVDLGDDAYIVATCKLAGLFELSNESIADDDHDIGSMLGMAVKDAMSPQLDDGLLFGQGAPEPLGLMDVAPIAVERDDFRATIIGAWGELVDAGADPTSIVAFASASTVAFELARTTTDGVPIHPDGAAPMVGPGVRMVAVPSLSAGQTLVVDTSRTFLVVRNDFQVDFSEHASFGTDGTQARIKGRFSVACPHPTKSLRVIASAS